MTGSITGLQNGDNITATYSCCRSGLQLCWSSYSIVQQPCVDPTIIAQVLSTGVAPLNNGSLTVTAAFPGRHGQRTSDGAYGQSNPALTGSIARTPERGQHHRHLFLPGDGLQHRWILLHCPNPERIPIIVPGNYSVTLNDRNPDRHTTSPLAVTKPTNVSRQYGQSNPALTGSITGLQNGDNITATYSCTAAASSSVGAYSIVPTPVDPNHRTGNYSVTS